MVATMDWFTLNLSKLMKMLIITGFERALFYTDQPSTDQFIKYYNELWTQCYQAKESMVNIWMWIVDDT